MGLDWTSSAGEETEGILSSCLQGMFMNTALRHADGGYQNVVTHRVRSSSLCLPPTVLHPSHINALVTGEQPLKIHPSSILHGKGLAAIMYNEVVYTTQLYARGVSAIQPLWIRDKAPSFFGQRSLFSTPK